MSKKVLHIINGDLYAGAERVQDLLALNLPAFGYHVGFAGLKTGTFSESRKAQRARLYTFPMRNRIDFRVVSNIVNVAKNDEYHLIHAHTPRTALIGQLVSIWSGLPMVYHVHGPTTRDTEQIWRNRRNALVERISIMRARHFIPVSAAAQEYAQSLGISSAKMTMVWNGVETPEQRNHSSPGDKLIIGAVALFRPRKGVEILIRALSRIVTNTQRPLMLHMIGDFETPQYEAKIKNLARDLGVMDHVNWVGFTTDVFAQLAKMDIFVLPSLYGEGLPMVLLEAMAAAVPIVATRVGGIEEAVEHGRHGLLVKPGDDVAMAAAFSELITGHINGEELARKARQRQIEHFSDRSMAAGVAAVYDRILTR